MARKRPDFSQLTPEAAEQMISEAAAEMPMPEAPALAAQKAAIARKIEDPARQMHHQVKRPLYITMSLAIFCPLVIVIVAMWFLAPVEYFETAKGETLHIALKDGSTVDLGGDSQLRVLSKFGNKHRSVELGGEAFFNVVKGREPFKVKTETTEVTVVGTSFRVKETARKVSLHVFEGVVTFASRVDDPAKPKTLKAGLTADYVQGKGVTPAVTFNPADWPDNSKGAFLFQETSLPQVCERLETYFGIQIELEPSLQNKRVSGRIQSEDPREILDLLATLIPIHWTENNGHFTLKPAP